MREGLRSTTVSQRKGDRRRRRRTNQSESRRAVKPVNDVGLAGDSSRVKNLLPDLNSEANPTEFDPDWLCNGEYAGRDASESKGTLVENGAEGFPVDDSMESKGVLDTDGKGGDGKDPMNACLVRMEHCEQEGNGVLRNSGGNMIDINAEVLESDELDCNNLYASEKMILEKDKTAAVDVILEPETVSNDGCDVDTAPCLEDNDLNETKMELNGVDCSADDISVDLQSRAVVLECVSENVTSSMDSLGDRQDTIGGKKIVPEIDKLQFGGKVLRSRVVSTPIEGQLSGYSRRKRATDCQVNETEVTGNDEISENLNGSNKKHKVSSERPGEKENIDLRSLPHGEDAVAEGLKNDEGNGFSVGQNKTDNECWETSGRKDENTDLLSNMIVKDDTASEVLNDIGKELGVELGLDTNQNRKVGRGRGRPRKQYNNNVSVNLLHESIEGSLEGSVMLKQEENNRLTDGTNKQQEGTLGGLKKRNRGRPRKIDKENGPEETNNAGTGMKKLGSHKIVKGIKKNPSGNSPNLMPQNDEAAPKDEIKLMKDGDNEGADTTNKWNKFRQGRLKKRKRGRPRKLNKENDAQERIPPDQEVIDKVKVKTRASGTLSPSFVSKLKRKGENTGEEPSKSESQLSSKCSVKVKSSSSTREEKQLVRQQIVEMLINAGWTVEYKPRQGKVYHDAVYRSPQGRTHWSVTLAYRVLKRQVELGKVTDFIFTPIPEEKLSTLFRVQVRTRSDKNQPRIISSGVKSEGRKKGGYTSDGEGKIGGSLFKRKPSSSKKQNKRRCALLVRRSGHGPSSAAEYMSVSGKHSILSWMIECGVISPGGKVQYRRRTKALLEGSITRDGIHCSCCSQLHSVAQFEAHADLKSCQMYENLYLENGSSFLHCQLELWNKQEESIRLGFHNVNVDNNDPNDDTCGICGDGGQLVCCDGCPSTFHSSCLNIEFPSGDWHCVYCSCKYCGTAGCDVDEDSDEHNKSPSLLTCCLCDGKYHQFCMKDCVYDLPSGSAFCGKTCEQIYERLQQLLGVQAEVGDGYTCTLIKRPDSGSSPDALEPKEIENVSKLAIALSVMDECFLPIIDHRSGINLMRHTLYSCGSNIKRLNFRGFFTAILEKEDEIIAAASIRIRGKELAEMPFIGTRNAYRRQGMCRRLLRGLESALSSLSIEKLVIPAVSEVTETWTSVFGFEPLQELGSEMIHMNLLVFPGVDMLQKPLLGQEFVGATAFNRVGKDGKPGDSQSKKHAEENGFETEAEEGCLSEKFEPSIEALQEAELSSEDGSHIPLKSAAIDREEGREGGTGDTAVEGRDNNVANKADACSDHNLVDLNVQPNSSIDCPKLDLELINPLENVGADLSANSFCNCDLPSVVSCVNVDGNPVEVPASSQTSPKLVNIKFNEVNGQSSEHVENLLIVDHSISDDAHVTAKTPGYFESDMQIDENIVTPFNLETSCNMGSGSNDLGTPVSFHACSAPEVGSK